MSPYLQVDSLSKAFRDKRLYRDFSFTFENGLYSVVGVNGVGKTVLLDMLAGVVKPDTGSIELFGIGFSASIQYKQKLVYVPSKPSFFPMATGREFLKFIAAVKRVDYGSKELLTMLEEFKLSPYLDVKFKDMSLGTQKKLFLATLVIGDNRLVILDEPSNGLDADSHRLLGVLLGKMSDKAVVIVATHDQSLLAQQSPVLLQLSAPPNSSFEGISLNGDVKRVGIL
jgi:ABC-2 type transport system ATP-binding protein